MIIDKVVDEISIGDYVSFAELLRLAKVIKFSTDGNNVLVHGLWEWGQPRPRPGNYFVWVKKEYLKKAEDQEVVLFVLNS